MSVSQNKNKSFLQQINTQLQQANQKNQVLMSQIAMQIQKRKPKNNKSHQKRQQIVFSLDEIKKNMIEMKKQCKQQYQKMFDNFFIQTIRIMKMYQNKIVSLQNQLQVIKKKQKHELSINIESQRLNHNISFVQSQQQLHSLRTGFEQFSEIKPKKIKICDILASYKSSIHQEIQQTTLNLEMPQVLNNNIYVDNYNNKSQQTSKYQYFKLKNYSSSDIHHQNPANPPILQDKSLQKSNIFHIDNMKTDLQNISLIESEKMISYKGKQNKEAYINNNKRRISQGKDKDLQKQDFMIDSSKIFESKISQLRKNMLSKHRKK